MVDPNAISGQIFLILMLDQFSQCRKMRLNGRTQKFQTLTHQISLLAGLHTLSKLFHYRTEKQLILRHLTLSLEKHLTSFIKVP